MISFNWLSCYDGNNDNRMVTIMKQSSYYERDVNNNKHKIKEKIRDSNKIVVPNLSFIRNFGFFK